MKEFYILEAKSGLPGWYGCPQSRMRKIFIKNLRFAEQVFGVKCFKLNLTKYSLKMTFEASESQVIDFKYFLLAKTNQDVQGGSNEINIFSGGVDLRKLPGYVDDHASDIRSYTQPTVHEVYYPARHSG